MSEDKKQEAEKVFQMFSDSLGAVQFARFQAGRYMHTDTYMSIVTLISHIEASFMSYLIDQYEKNDLDLLKEKKDKIVNKLIPSLISAINDAEKQLNENESVEKSVTA